MMTAKEIYEATPGQLRDRERQLLKRLANSPYDKNPTTEYEIAMIRRARQCNFGPPHRAIMYIGGCDEPSRTEAHGLPTMTKEEAKSYYGFKLK